MIYQDKYSTSKYIKYILSAYCATLFLGLPTQLIAKQPELTTIKGLVFTQEENFPLEGANIEVKDTDITTQTNSQGEFTLENIPERSTLIVSHRGMISEKRKVKDVKFLQFMMEVDYSAIDQSGSVNIGYGSTSKKTLTGAVSNLDYEKTNGSGQDFHQSLSGQVAGVSIVSGSGEIGSDDSNSSIQIRGVTSVFAGNDPLYVVDGIPQESDPGLPSSEIQSIDILKDAASAAVYGTRGAAGVILITTKNKAQEELQKEAERERIKAEKRAIKEQNKTSED